MEKEIRYRKSRQIWADAAWFWWETLDNKQYFVETAEMGSDWYHVENNNRKKDEREEKKIYGEELFLCIVLNVVMKKKSTHVYIYITRSQSRRQKMKEL